MRAMASWFCAGVCAVVAIGLLVTALTSGAAPVLFVGGATLAALATIVCVWLAMLNRGLASHRVGGAEARKAARPLLALVVAALLLTIAAFFAEAWQGLTSLGLWVILLIPCVLVLLTRQGPHWDRARA